MGAGAFVEPLVVVSLLFGGVYVNRNTNYRLFAKRSSDWKEKAFDERNDDGPESPLSPISTDGFLEEGGLLARSDSTWRKREVSIWRLRFEVTSPNTAVFQDYFLSRLLRKLPFLVECWYWALIYWVSIFCFLGSFDDATKADYLEGLSSWKSHWRTHAR